MTQPSKGITGTDALGPHGQALVSARMGLGIDVGNDKLEQTLAQVEHHLESLGEALRERDPQAIDLHATQLHRALVQALDCFTHAARSGGQIPQPLRARLARAGAQVAVQRECLARATAALDRAIDAMLPKPSNSAGLYGASGKTTIDTSSSGVRV